jgi:hypothetical protein
VKRARAGKVALAIAWAAGAVVALAPARARAADAREGAGAGAGAPSARGEALASAQTPQERPGLRLGVRSGYALPAGKPFGGAGALSDTIAGQISAGVDVGWRFDGHVYAGLTGALGVVVPRGCPPGERCSGTDVRVGGMLAWRFSPAARFDPWVGVGAGYEILSTTQTIGSREETVTARGVELASVQLGFDVVAARSLRLGPFVGASLARYRTVTIGSMTTNDFDATSHGWLAAGMRGAWDP